MVWPAAIGTQACLVDSSTALNPTKLSCPQFALSQLKYPPRTRKHLPSRIRTSQALQAEDQVQQRIFPDYDTRTEATIPRQPAATAANHVRRGLGQLFLAAKDVLAAAAAWVADSMAVRLAGTDSKAGSAILREFGTCAA